MGTLLIVLAAAVATIVVVLTIIGYINNIFSIAERINQLTGHTPKPATAEQQEETNRLLREIRGGLARPPQGAADMPTDELAKAAGPDTGARLQEALELQAQNKHKEAIDALYEAFRKDLEPRAKAQLHGLIGNSFASISELEEAEGHYRQALSASRTGKIRKYEAASLGNLGNVYANKGDLERAGRQYQAALAIDREIGNRRGEASALGNLGNVYAGQGDLERAKEHYNAALAFYRESGYRQGEASQLGNLGIVYADQGDLPRAEEHHQAALSIHRVIGHREGEANELINLGRVYNQQGDLTRAEEHCRGALVIDRQISNRLGEAQDLGNLGVLAAKRDRRDEACRLLKQAAGLYDQVGAGGQGPDSVRAKLRELGCE